MNKVSKKQIDFLNIYLKLLSQPLDPFHGLLQLQFLHTGN